MLVWPCRTGLRPRGRPRSAGPFGRPSHFATSSASGWLALLATLAWLAGPRTWPRWLACGLARLAVRGGSFYYQANPYEHPPLTGNKRNLSPWSRLHCPWLRGESIGLLIYFNDHSFTYIRPCRTLALEPLSSELFKRSKKSSSIRQILESGAARQHHRWGPR